MITFNVEWLDKWHLNLLCKILFNHVLAEQSQRFACLGILHGFQEARTLLPVHTNSDRSESKASIDHGSVAGAV